MKLFGVFGSQLRHCWSAILYFLGLLLLCITLSFFFYLLFSALKCVHSPMSITPTCFSRATISWSRRLSTLSFHHFLSSVLNSRVSVSFLHLPPNFPLACPSTLIIPFQSCTRLKRCWSMGLVCESKATYRLVNFVIGDFVSCLPPDCLTYDPYLAVNCPGFVCNGTDCCSCLKCTLRRLSDEASRPLLAWGVKG